MHTFKQFVRFVGVGGVATALQYLILVVLVSIFDIKPMSASTVGFLISSLVNYELNCRFTFNSASTRQKTMPLFYCVVAIGLLINALVMHIFVSVLLLHYLLSQIVATSVVLVSNFTLNRVWVFR